MQVQVAWKQGLESNWMAGSGLHSPLGAHPPIGPPCCTVLLPSPCPLKPPRWLSSASAGWLTMWSLQHCWVGTAPCINPAHPALMQTCFTAHLQQCWAYTNNMHQPRALLGLYPKPYSYYWTITSPQCSLVHYRWMAAVDGFTFLCDPVLFLLILTVLQMSFEWAACNMLIIDLKHLCPTLKLI